MPESKQNHQWGRCLRRLLVAAFAFGAVSIDLNGDPVLYFSYFTVLTNLGIGLWFFFAALAPAKLEKASLLRLMLTVYGLVTLLVYWVVLSPNHHPQGLNFWANLVLHLGVPLAMAGEDLVVPWPRITAWAALWSLGFPCFYAAFTLIRGQLTGWYPYFFFDERKWGNWESLATFMVLLLAVFLGLAYLWRVVVQRTRKATAK